MKTWLTAFALARFALAFHDGHGDPRWEGTAFHGLLEPEHGLQIVSVCVALTAIGYGWRLLRQSSRQGPRRD